MTQKTSFILITLLAVALGGYFYLDSSGKFSKSAVIGNDVLAARFEQLSKSGNSSCSATFKDSIATMADAGRLQGSCCSPMDWHRYQEQVEGLQQFSRIPEIPSDPYDIEAGLAKKLIA